MPPRRCALPIALGAACTITLAGCGSAASTTTGTPSPAAGPCEPCIPPTIAGVQAQVEEVQVGPFTAATSAPYRFRLFAWYEDAQGTEITGRFEPFEWSLPSADGSADIFGLVTLNQGATSEIPLTVRNPSGSFTDEVTLKRWNSVTDAGGAGEVVEAAHQSSGPPSAVLLEDPGDGGQCTWGQARAFVGIAAVGTRSGSPCSFSLFASNQAAVYEHPEPATGRIASWTNPFKPALTTPLDLDVVIFIAVTGRTPSLLSGYGLANVGQFAQDVADAAAAVAAMDVTWANLAFEANRVGIRIKPAYEWIDPTTPDLAALVGAHPFSCSKPRGLTQPNLAQPDDAYLNDKTKISIYYVDWINYPTDPLHAGARGVHCHFWNQGTPGPVIFISYTKHSTVTLAHEIGHALGLDDEADALGALNVMHNLLPDGPLGADARSRLTVGQVFRMNVWNDSWITTLTGFPRKTRLCRSYDTPCPEVSLDAR